MKKYHFFYSKFEFPGKKTIIIIYKTILQYKMITTISHMSISTSSLFGGWCRGFMRKNER